MSEKRKSPAWQYFTDVGDSRAKCNLCSQVISYKGGGPFNLLRHIKGKHKYHHLESNRSENPDDPPSISSHQLSLPSTSEVTVIADNRPRTSKVSDYFRPLSANKTTKLNRKLVKLICKNYLPFSFVESEAMKEFVRELNPSYHMPSRKTLSTALLDNFYHVEREKVQKDLQEIECISLTTDYWLSPASESYLSLTAHFINTSGELKSVMLECVVFQESKTSEHVAEKIKELCEEWKIWGKVISITTDNASNMTKAVELLKINHVPCFAHTLNLVVTKALESITMAGIKANIKEIVENFRRSSIAIKKLSQEQKKRGEQELKLKNDMPTRWNSTFIMFERVIEVHESLSHVLSFEYPTWPQLSKETIRVLKNANELLAVFKSISEEMSSEKMVTISELIPLSKLLVEECNKFSLDPNTPEVKIMASLMKTEYQSRFKEIEASKLFSTATILDPRFKKLGFESQNQAKQAADRVVSLAAKVSNPIEEERVAEPSPPKKKPYSIWDKYDQEVETMVGNPTPKSAAIVEVDKYFQEPLLKRNMNPLKWWYEKKDIYPRLYKIAKRRLCIPATSVPSERLFSKSGLVLSDRRNRLSGGKVAKILFLNYNMDS